MKKLINALFYVLIAVLFWMVFNYDHVLPLIAEFRQSEGFALEVVNAIKNFFKHASGYHYFGLAIVVCVVGMVFLLLERGLPIFFTLLSNSFPWLKFCVSAWFMYVQKALSVITVMMLVLIASNAMVIYHSSKFLVSGVEEIKEAQPVVILGTSRNFGNGINEYYQNRIDAGLELWRSGKVQYFIVSGDKNDSTDYDETRDMKNDLLAGGVPEDRIKIDTAGFRTLDSIVRIRELFKINKMILVSQEFHLTKALFLAWYYDIESLGFKAKGNATIKMMVREVGAKPWMLCDVFLRNTQPRSGQFTTTNEFSLNSNLDAWLFIMTCIMVAFFAFFFIRTLNQNTTGFKWYLSTGSVMVTVVILLSGAAYRADVIEISVVNNLVENFAEITSIGKDMVKEKQERKVIASVKKAIIKQNKILEAEIYKPIDIVDDPENLIEKETELVSDTESEKGIKALLGFKSKDLILKVTTHEKSSIESVDVIEKEEDSMTGLFGSTGVVKEESNSFISESAEIDFAAVISKSQIVKNLENLEVRVRESFIVNGVSIVKNKIIKAKVSVVGERVHLSFILEGKEGHFDNSKTKSGFHITELKADKKGGFIFTEGIKLFGKI